MVLWEGSVEMIPVRLRGGNNPGPAHGEIGGRAAKSADPAGESGRREATQRGDPAETQARSPRLTPTTRSEKVPRANGGGRVPAAGGVSGFR